MRRFGFNPLIVFLVVIIGAGSSCMEDYSYSEGEIGKLSTLVRTTLDITKGKYYGKTLPSQMNEDEIVQIILSERPHFKELELLEGEIELMFVSNGTDIGAIIWDSGNNRKLIQDLQCTRKLDDPTYQREEFGNTFTLDWKICSDN